MYAYRAIPIILRSSLQFLKCIFFILTLDDLILQITSHRYVWLLILDGQKNGIFLLFPLRHFSKEMNNGNSLDVKNKYNSPISNNIEEIVKHFVTLSKIVGQICLCDPL